MPYKFNPFTGNMDFTDYNPVNYGKLASVFASGKRTKVSVGSNTTLATSNGVAYYQPFMAGNTTTLTKIEVEVVTTPGSAGSVVRCGLYADDGTGGGPGALITDYGTVATDTTGVKSITISEPIKAGTIYWVCTVAQGAPVTSPTMRAFTGSNWNFPTSSAVANIASMCLTQASVTGSLPSTAAPTSGASSVFGASLQA